MRKVTVFHGEDETVLYSDLLASKEFHGKSGKPYNQLISFSLIGTESEIERVIKKRGSLEMEVEEGGEIKEYKLNNMQNYEVIEKQEGRGSKVRYTVTRKVERMIKTDEEQERKLYPKSDRSHVVL